MKKILLTILIAIFGIISCKKDTVLQPLDGSWKLTKIYDRVNDVTLFPTTNSGDYILLQIQGEKFSGKTFKNTISDGSFTLPKNGQITFGFYNSTYVSEDEYGLALFTVLNSCQLSSYAPCKPCDYILTSSSLVISSPYMYELTFEK